MTLRVLALASAASFLAAACSPTFGPTPTGRPNMLIPCDVAPGAGGNQGEGTAEAASASVGPTRDAPRLHRYCLQLELEASVDRTQIVSAVVFSNQATDPLHNRDVLVYHPGGPGLFTVSTMVQEPLPVDLDSYVLLTWDGTTSGIGLGACGPASIAFLTERTPEDFVGRAKATSEECLGAFGGPADLGAWAAAEELEAIRVALGVDRVDLLTFSYGTAIAEAYLRAHPARVRRAVLDAPVGLDVPWLTRLQFTGAALRDGADRLAGSCATEGCRAVLADVPPHAAYEAIRTAVLERRPAVGSGRLVLTPVMFDQATELALRDEANWQDFALAVEEALDGDGSSLWRVAERLYLDLDRGVFYQSLCADIDRPGDPRQYVVGTDPLVFAFGSELAPCGGFPRGVARQPDADTAVEAAEVLVVASNLDVLAPVSLARNAAFLASRGALCETEVPGHTSFGDPAVQQLVLEFLRSGDATGIAARC